MVNELIVIYNSIKLQPNINVSYDSSYDPVSFINSQNVLINTTKYIFAFD